MTNPFTLIREEWEKVEKEGVADFNNHWGPSGIEHQISFVDWRRKQASITLKQLLKALEEQYEEKP